MTIFKYPLELEDQQTVTMPMGSRVLCVQVQRGRPCLWAMVDSEVVETEQHHIRIYGTGHPIDRHPSRYYGTFQLKDTLVFHVFEESKK